MFAAIAAAELPPEAGGNPEGWLAPGTYAPADDAGARDVVQAMVDRRVAQLEERNVPRDQWHRVLTAASVIETETYNQSEKPGVARVLTNRVAGGGPLQMDSIILSPVPEDRIFTTSAERASDQPYNSYRHDGLPPTPISAPDEASIDASDAWLDMIVPGTASPVTTAVMVMKRRSPGASSKPSTRTALPVTLTSPTCDAALTSASAPGTSSWITTCVSVMSFGLQTLSV